MKFLLEITIVVALNIFLFGYVQRKMAILILAQRNQILVLKHRRRGNIEAVPQKGWFMSQSN